MQINQSGYREIDVDHLPETVAKFKAHWQDYISKVKEPTDFGRGNGIVMSAGGLSYFTCAWITIHRLRKIGCTLPIEVWYNGSELSQEVITQLTALGVKCRNFLDYGDYYKSGYILKVLSLLYTDFENVLYLDADNIPLRDPSELFLSAEFEEKGAIFWPDYWKTTADNPIWQITNNRYVDEQEQESGQLLVNRSKCWHALQLSFYFNLYDGIYHRLLHGDKDTFRFAWKALSQEYHMIEGLPSNCGNRYMEIGEVHGIAMIQHGLNGEMMFLHRNLLKWDLTYDQEYVMKEIVGFEKNATKRTFGLYRTKEMGFAYVVLTGDTFSLNFCDLFNGLERDCLEELAKLRALPFYHRFMIYCHQVEVRFRSEYDTQPEKTLA